jgi:hypothetical protein
MTLALLPVFLNVFLSETWRFTLPTVKVEMEKAGDRQSGRSRRPPPTLPPGGDLS